MMGDGMSQFVRRIQAQHEAMAKALAPIAKSMRHLDATLQPMREFGERMRRQSEAIQKLTEPMRLSFANMQQRLEPMRELMRRFVEQHQHLKEHFREAQAYLFDEGWYLGGDMPLPNYRILAGMVNDAQHEDIEEAMCSWSREQTDGIAVKVSEVFPRRAGLVGAAIDAHRAGGYALSIPVLFAQADGMANEVIGSFLFRGDPVGALESTLSQFERFPLSGFSDIVLDPLRTKSRFYTCSTRQTLKRGHVLANRSEVLHGTQLDYASERNSLRAIVLVGYLAGVKTALESHAQHVDGLLAAIEEAVTPENGERDSDEPPSNGT